jgi:DNA-binding transcriptional ArsR family regulator
MKEEQPNYYAVIPASVRYADISSSAKLLYGEITALCNKEGYCWANNTYFANLYKVSKFTVSRWISELRDNELIIVDIIKQELGKEVSRKLIIKEQYLLTKTAIPIEKKRKGGIDENRKDNNTSINNKYNKGFSQKKKPYFMGKIMSEDLKWVIWGKNDLRQFAGDKEDIVWK